MDLFKYPVKASLAKDGNPGTSLPQERCWIIYLHMNADDGQNIHLAQGGKVQQLALGEGGSSIEN